MSQLFFYLQYAARNLWRSRRWSAFAMLSIAAGVAAVVALRSLGLGIADSLTSNIRSSNKGDITLERGSSGFAITPAAFIDDQDVFNPAQLAIIRDWVEDRGATHSEYISTTLQVTAVDQAGAGMLNFMTAILIDPATYPPTQDIFAIEPHRVPLGELFEGGFEVVISQNLAEMQGVDVGDQVRVSGTTELFTVRGIVPTETEAGLRNPLAAFFGFVYMDLSQTDTLSIDSRPNRVSILLPGSPTHDQITAASDDLTRHLRGAGGWTRTVTVPRLVEQNEVIADITGRLVVIMGLGAMLLGGVGIINTMLVMVRRRTNEIAALKTFGLRGRQVAALFMTEGLLLGLVGSVFGMVIGLLLSLGANRFGETFIQQPIAWRLYPEALLFGLVLGVVVSAIFGVIPVLTALQVRPGIILRPNETHIPTLGLLQSLGGMLFVVVALGVVAGQIIGPLPEGTPSLFGLPFPPNISLGLVGVAGALLILGILVCMLWVLVWLVGKLPAFGSVDLRLALVNLRSHRMRTATTLLAISVGMFALSSITFYGASLREVLQFNLSQTFGGNVMVITPATLPGTPQFIAQTVQNRLDGLLDELDGVEYRTRFGYYRGQIVEVDGRSLEEDNLAAAEQDRIMEEMRRAGQAQDFERMGRLGQQLQAYQDVWIDISVQNTNNPNFVGEPVSVGRRLTLEDTGQPVAVVRRTSAIEARGIEIGSEIVIALEDGREITFEVVGMTEADSQTVQTSTFGTVQLPPGSLPGLRPQFQIDTVQVRPEAMNEVLLEISSVFGFFPINISFIDGVISRFIDQFSALPILIGLLSLAAAAVIMANTVALATLERRRQIGILKSVGLKSRRVLGIMLLENLIVSLLGGLLGIGLSALGVAMMSLFGMDDLVLIPRDAQPVAAALVTAAVLIGGIATFLSANVAVRERVLNVLRYD
jgi:putative ABC transport system permease protein